VRVNFGSSDLERFYTTGATPWKPPSMTQRFFLIVETLKGWSRGDLEGKKPLGWHPLVGDREGQFGLALSERHRLCVAFSEDEDGEYIVVIDATDHYGKAI